MNTNTNNIITTANAAFWAAIFSEVEKINKLNSVDEFYGIGKGETFYQVAPVEGLKEIHQRLHGWRKEAYKNFIMSGWFDINQFGEKMVPNSWGYGRYTCAKKASAQVHKYPLDAHDWVYDLEGEYEISLSWEDICKMY